MNIKIPKFQFEDDSDAKNKKTKLFPELSDDYLDDDADFDNEDMPDDLPPIALPEDMINQLNALRGNAGENILNSMLEKLLAGMSPMANSITNNNDLSSLNKQSTQTFLSEEIINNVLDKLHESFIDIKKDINDYSIEAQPFDLTLFCNKYNLDKNLMFSLPTKISDTKLSELNIPHLENFDSCAFAKGNNNFIFCRLKDCNIQDENNYFDFCFVVYLNKDNEFTVFIPTYLNMYDPNKLLSIKDMIEKYGYDEDKIKESLNADMTTIKSLGISIVVLQDLTDFSKFQDLIKHEFDSWNKPSKLLDIMKHKFIDIQKNNSFNINSLGTFIKYEQITHVEVQNGLMLSIGTLILNNSKDTSTFISDYNITPINNKVTVLLSIKDNQGTNFIEYCENSNKLSYDIIMPASDITGIGNYIIINI